MKKQSENKSAFEYLTIAERNSTVEIEKINNGYLLRIRGNDAGGNYRQDSLYCADLVELSSTIEKVMALPEN